MAIKVDATSLVVGLEDGSIEIWERVGQASNGSKLPQAQPFKRLNPFHKHNDLVRVIDLSPNFVVSGSWDASIKLWNRKSGKLIDTYMSPEGTLVQNEIVSFKNDLASKKGNKNIFRMLSMTN